MPPRVCLLTQLTDELSQLFEGGAEAFVAGWDFQGVHHEGHTVDSVPEAGRLHVTRRFCANWLIRTELRTEWNKEIRVSFPL